jgi:hypothetical protein
MQSILDIISWIILLIAPLAVPIITTAIIWMYNRSTSILTLILYFTLDIIIFSLTLGFAVFPFLAAFFANASLILPAISFYFVALIFSSRFQLTDKTSAIILVIRSFLISIIVHAGMWLSVPNSPQEIEYSAGYVAPDTLFVAVASLIIGLSLILGIFYGLKLVFTDYKSRVVQSASLDLLISISGITLLTMVIPYVGSAGLALLGVFFAIPIIGLTFPALLLFLNAEKAKFSQGLFMWIAIRTIIVNLALFGLTALIWALLGV